MKNSITSFKQLFEDLSSRRKTWILQIAANLFGVTDRQIRRYINAHIEELSPMERNTLAAIFETAENTKDIGELETIEAEDIQINTEPSFV